MDPRFAAPIRPEWTLVFCKKPGRWWVRLLAWGRYNHVKAIAYLPALRAWLLYDVRFNGTHVMLARKDDPGTAALLHDYLDNCDTIAMPPRSFPRRAAPHPGFWCTLAMKHLVGIRSGALRPDRLWRDSIAAGGTPYTSDGASAAPASMELLSGQQPLESMLTFLKAHAETSNASANQLSWWDDAAFGRPRSKRVAKLRRRIRTLQEKVATGGRRRRPYYPASVRS